MNHWSLLSAERHNIGGGSTPMLDQINLQFTGEFQCPLWLTDILHDVSQKCWATFSPTVVFFPKNFLLKYKKKKQKKQLVCWGTLIGSFFFDSKFLMLRYLHLSNATFFIWWIKTSYKFTNNYIIVTDNWIRRIVFKGH